MQVKKMECDFCRVQTEEGNCLLHSVKVGGSLIKNYNKVLRKLKMFVYNPLVEFILEYLKLKCLQKLFSFIILFYNLYIIYLSFPGSSDRGQV